MTSKDQNIFNGDEMDRKFINSKSIDEKIREIEDRIKNLTEKSMGDIIQNAGSKQKETQFLQDKLHGISDNIKKLTDETKVNIKETEPVLEQSTQNTIIQDGNIGKKLSDLEQKIKSFDSLTSESQNVKNEMGSTLRGYFGKENETENKESAVKEKLEAIDKQIKDIKDSITAFYTTASASSTSAIEEKLKSIEEKLRSEKPKTNYGVKHGPITIKPRKKKEGLFNDVNLTEDYELGFRFYQLGFKTGFFNVKLDKDDEASRIATAEFFPNTFWASVKQRSRWVAGIVFQNWKAHKWMGNLSTKYFLFRDRKSIFSFFSAFLSNIVILYFIYAILASIFGLSKPYSLVGNSSVLWYLMVANLIFMISRLSHRFVFTYNWYGFKYAFFSLFRLPLDTVINFFAIARSLNVYKKTRTQEKVVWDSTSHY